jgi:predicted O-methyltransferase YrrM
MDRNGLKMYIDPRDIGVVAHLVTTCTWEPNETRLVRSLAKPGQKWIEVGANFGYYTIMLGDLLRNGGKLFAFEGSPRFMKYLKDSISVDGLKSIVDFF